MTTATGTASPAPRIELPTPCLVVLVGASGSGKSSFARKHFAPTEVLSSDFFRGLVAGDENDQTASDDAFAALHDVLGRRLRRGVLTVVDATNVEEDGRRALVAIAKEHDVLAVAIVLDVPTGVCHARNAARPDRAFGKHVVARQRAALRRGLRSLKSEGFHRFVVLDGVAAVDAATIARVRLWNDRRDEHGPFDVIGDVHGCRSELETLLGALGYARSAAHGGAFAHPAGRRAVLLGDLVDRGPDVPGCLRIAMEMVGAGSALVILGNHEAKLLKKLRGADVKVGAGLRASVEQLAAESDAFRAEVERFLAGLVAHYVLDGGKLVVAHAGMKEAYQGRASGRVREFALYGETTGEIDGYGLPVRQDWAASYRGRAAVVYGHTPVPRAQWVNGTLCVDTGCVFGGALTALRWPERELVSVPAERVHFEPVRPLERDASAPEARAAETALSLGDVVGRRAIETRALGVVTIRDGEAAAALEVMSRFAVDPRWLVYLPPTMSPADAAPEGDLLERPEEAFAHYLDEGVGTVLCEEKHMGSRAIAVVCRDAATAARRFGDGTRAGVLYTRTGRPFFEDPALEARVLDGVRDGMERAGLWKELGTDWVVLDGELMPWSVKALELIRRQYAATGAAGVAALDAAVAVLSRAALHDPSAQDALRSATARRAHVHAFRDVYRRYSSEAPAPSAIRFAPFHLLATEGVVHDGLDHAAHLAVLTRLAEAAPDVLASTPRLRVELGDAESEAAGRRFWDDMTARGAEGMVVKPLSWTAATRRGPVQPALKVRGREYLRLVYGPEYVEPSRLARLRRRNVRHKRRLALREHALGMEALHRFVSSEPLHRVHECVFGVLALESEPVDPRL